VRIRIAIAVCLTVTAICVGVALTRTPLVVAGSDGTPTSGEIGAVAAPTTICQPAERIPQGTTAIRVSLLSLLGPRLKLRASAGGVPVTSGELGYGWTGMAATIPIARVARSHAHTTICVTLAKRRQLVNLRGVNTKLAPAVGEGGQILPGRMRFDYLRPDTSSWLSLALPTARRIGLTIGGGGGIVLIPFLLMLTCVVLMSWRLERDLG
jgi:hypothetical protein